MPDYDSRYKQAAQNFLNMPESRRIQRFNELSPANQQKLRGYLSSIGIEPDSVMKPRQGFDWGSGIKAMTSPASEWWQRPLGAVETVFKPFQAVTEFGVKPVLGEVYKGAVTLALGEQTSEAQLRSGAISGKEAWERWRAPLPLIKGLAEEGLNPLNIVPFAAPIKGVSIAARAAGAIKLASGASKVAKGVATAERIMAYPIAKPIEVAIKQVAKRLPGQATKLSLTAMPSNAELIADVAKRHPERLQVQGSRGTLGATGRLLAIRPSTKGQIDEVTLIAKAGVVRDAGQEYGSNQTKTLMATFLDPRTPWKGKPYKDLFQVDEKGIIHHPAIVPKENKRGLAFNGKDQGNVLGQPDSFEWVGDEGKALRQWVNQHQAGWEALGKLKDVEGVPVHLRQLEPGETYVGRFMVAIEREKPVIMHPTAARVPGSKTTGEKRMVFGPNDMGKAIKLGYRYAPPDEGLAIASGQAYNRIAGMRAAEVMFPMTKTISQRMDIGVQSVGENLLKDFKDALYESKLDPMGKWDVAQANETYRDSLKLLGAVRRASRGESLPGPTIDALEKRFPGMRQRLEAVMGKEPTATQVIPEAPLSPAVPSAAESAAAKGALPTVPTGQARTPQVSTATEQMFQALEKTNPGIAGTLRGKLAKSVPLTTGQGQRMAGGTPLTAQEQRANIINAILDEAKSGADKAKVDLQTLLAADKAKRQATVDMTRKDWRAYAPIYKAAKLRAQTPTATEGVVYEVPALRNKIIEDVRDENGTVVMYGKDLAKMINDKFKHEEVNAALRKASELTRASVSLTASMDLSWPMIQGWLVLGHDLSNLALAGVGKATPTNHWGKAVMGMFRTAINPQYMERFIAENADYLARHPTLITELSEFYGGLEGIAKVAGKIPGLGPMAGKAYQQTYGRMGAAFTAPGIIARVEASKALEQSFAKRLGLTVKDLPLSAINEMDEIANKLTGVMSSKAIGAGGTQRAMESTALFAPRYLRVNVMVLRDMFGNPAANVTAREAQKAIGGVLAALTASYVGLSIAMGQSPKLNPLPPKYGGDGGKFMTVEIGGVTVGIGGFTYGMIRLAGGLAGAAATDPSALVKMDVRQNPALQFLMGRSSPLVSLGQEIVTGRDFFGNRLEDSTDWLKVAADKAMPFMLSSLLIEKNGTWETLPGQFAGMRTWPRGEWETRDKLRDTYAAPMGKKWDDLPKGTQDDLERQHPDLAAMTEKIKTDRNQQQGTDVERAYAQQQAGIKVWFDQNIENIAKLKAEGSLNWERYNDLRDDYLTERFSTSATLFDMKSLLDPEQAADFGKWLEKNQKPEDKAMEGYREVLREPVIGQDNLPDWAATYGKADEYLQKLDTDTRLYIQAHERDWVKDLPETAQAIERERQSLIDSLRPYWDLRTALTKHLQVKGGADIERLQNEWDKTSYQLRKMLLAKGYPPEYANSYINSMKKSKYPTLKIFDAMLDRTR
ncbi:MAG: hypothetical protein Q7T04_00710, partial [Dehalococcoidia bacterium]|nr:hypothetical protein [Dehalococcoidia bacterium]